MLVWILERSPGLLKLYKWRTSLSLSLSHFPVRSAINIYCVLNFALCSLLCRILNITEMVGDKMSYFDQTNYTLVASAMAISVVDVDRDQFQVLTFGVSSAAEGLNPEVSAN